jgi:hypothetical protein
MLRGPLRALAPAQRHAVSGRLLEMVLGGLQPPSP